ncbi:unnamed protein product [Aureobasidium mustum]|uniref:F-box domain-containing protein n=1 Tax=Aureobasidium mustum TaxID=2773714 RepID=A0A9N8K1X7_9PEZI|nr:unnamed protein product [Aureobasidium mustum]
MEDASGPLTVAAQVQSLAPDQSTRVRRISFTDFPAEVKNLIYYYLCRDRTKRAINLCVLSPAWKSPSPPTALMNTCSSIASRLMPVYFSNCLFTIDTTHKANAQLLTGAFEWLKNVGDKSSAHFRRLHVIHEFILPPRPQDNFATDPYEVMISITDEEQIIIEEIRGPSKCLREMDLRPSFRRLYLRLDKQLTDDLVEMLTHRIYNNQTAGMGVTEFEIILERISFHVSRFKKAREDLQREELENTPTEIGAENKEEGFLVTALRFLDLYHNAQSYLAQTHFH